MTKTVYSVPYGRGVLSFELPPEIRATVVTSRRVRPLMDVRRALERALRNPVASPPLRELAKPGNRVCIVVTDITRACPDHLLVPPLLEELNAGGVRDDDITIIVGIGAHRASTAEEKVAKLGEEVVQRVEVIDPSPSDPTTLVDLGSTSGGVPILLNKIVTKADLLIATGIVEPHQYAGYSGGRKTLAIGIAGEQTISHTHGPSFLDHPKTRLGNIEGNPFHEAITEIAERARLRFILNVVADDNGEIIGVCAGRPDAAFKVLVEKASKIYTASVDRVFDFAVAGVGFPKDANLYQASRAASYLFFAPKPVVRPGGIFIVPAKCQEGAGKGPGEQRFWTVMRDAPSVRSILDHAQRHGIAPGEQRAYIMAKVLEQNDVVIVGSDYPEIVEQAKMIPVATMEEALVLAQRRLGRSLEALIVPHALLTLPVLRRQ